MAIPILGLFFAYSHPPGLVEPPPLRWTRVLLLVGKTLALAGFVSFFSLILGTFLGILQGRASYPGRRLLSLLSLLPLAVPSYLLAAIVRESMAPQGALGEWLGTEGIFSGFWPAVFVLTLSCTPYVHLLVSSAMSTFAAGEDEAARSLGAPFWRRFTQLLIPRLRPTWAYSLVLIALYVVSDFGAVAVLDCEVLTWELYQARGAQDAIVLGFAMMACVIPLLAVVRFLGGNQAPERGLGQSRGETRIPLRRGMRGLAYGGHAFLIGFGVVLPVVTLISWVWAGVANHVTFAPLTEPLVATALFTTVGAFVTLVVAFFPAWLVVRYASPKMGKFLENGTYFTSALPGILLAFGLLHLILGLRRSVPIEVGGTPVWDGLETVGVFLVLGYVMRFLAEGYAALKPSILALDLRQEESAKSLGASSWRRLTQVTLPLLFPGVAAAFLLLFVSIAKELPVTLMLTPTGVQTLAYRVFDAQQEASFPDVGVAGLILLVLAVSMQGILMRRRRHV